MTKQEKDKIFNENINLVHFVINRYFSNAPCEREDLFQEGCIGLYDAIDKYEKDKGTLATYATNWIRQRIQIYVTKNSRLIRVPQHVNLQITKLEHAKKQLNLEGKDCTVENLYEKLQKKMSKEKITELIKVGNTVDNTLSLDRQLRNDQGEETDGLYYIPDTADTPDIEYEITERTKALKQALSKLFGARKANIIFEYYGVDCEPKNLRELSEKYGISGERIRQQMQSIRKADAATKTLIAKAIGYEDYTPFKPNPNIKTRKRQKTVDAPIADTA